MNLGGINIKTIIDILRRGNQELFHSKMIAWLLNPNGEHGFQYAFLKKFISKLCTLGCKELINIMNSKDFNYISTETVHYKRRYDIELKIGDTLIVIENKTKSLGDVVQFEKYSTEDNILIALGYCDVSFSPQVSENYIVITYKDILKILREIPSNNNNDFSVLVKHYILYLERELSILDLIDECYKEGEIELHNNIPKMIPTSYSKNDIRFINLYFLEKFKSKLDQNNIFAGTIWDTKKDEQSGAWLANYRKLPNYYKFNSYVSEFIEKYSVNLWMHIELKDGVMGNNLEDKVGLIQLRCSTDSPNRDVLKEFKNIYKCSEGEQYVSSTSNKYNTFYLVKRMFTKKELQFDLLEDILISFMKNFGCFVLY